MLRSVAGILVLGAFALSGCEPAVSVAGLEPPDGGPSGSPSISVSPSEATLVGIGSSVQLQATAQTGSGSAAPASQVSWTSLEPQVATVSSQGLVTAAGLGTARVTARYQGVADTATIVVELAPTISVTPEQVTLNGIGTTIQLEATAHTNTGETAPGSAITWASLEPQVATVSSQGLVRAVATGTARITASYQSATVTVSIIVQAAPPPSPPSLAVSPKQATLTGVGATLQLQATGQTSSGGAVPSSQIVWISLEPQIVTVGVQGLVTAAAAGTARITATYQSVADTATILVQVSSPPSTPSSPSIAVSPKTVTLTGVGATVQLQATAKTATGASVSSSEITWTSLNPQRATVSTQGLVTAVAAGTARIRAAYQTAADTATITVQVSSTPSAPTISVSPKTATLTGIGNTLQLLATAKTSTGASVPSSEVGWTSLQPSVATVSSAGMVTAVAAGTARIRAAYQTVADTSTITVESGALPPPPSPGQWNRVLANVTIQEDVVVPDGETWLIGANVQIAGNLRTVGGTIAMRPGSSLKFLGANPDAYVGGGMTFEPQFARDIGLWIGPQGALDIQGTPKQGWNRTGTHETWKPTDEYWISPTAAKDYAPRRWFPGDPIPQVDPRVPPAEVMNVTRDIGIEGPGHIHIHSTRPQRIEYVQLRAMGVSNSAFATNKGPVGPVLGRYALHLHMSGDGTRGTMIRGVAAVNSGGTVFVPHSSHGITMIDNVSVNSVHDGLWWDRGHETNDLLVDRLSVSGVTGGTAINNHVGTGNIMRNSAASGARGAPQSDGFEWSIANEAPGVWEFDVGNVAHNVAGHGIRFWTNSPRAHVVRNAIVYRSGGGQAPEGNGILTGAYRNTVRYEDVLVLGTLEQHANSKTQEIDGGPGRYERVQVYALDGPAVVSMDRNLAAEQPWEFIDCTLVPAAGHPKVLVKGGGTPWLALFRRSGVVPDDVVFETLSGNEGTRILIEHEDGRRWEIKVENGQKIVRQL